VNRAPVLCELEVDSAGRVKSAKGLFIDVVRRLQETLNFSVELTMPADGKWGILQADGKTWQGLVGLLVNKSTDIVASGLSHTADRLGVTDFSVPLEEDIVTLIGPRYKCEESNHLTVYIDLLAVESWCLCALGRDSPIFKNYSKLGFLTRFLTG
jgi:hypothetical protein